MLFFNELGNTIDRRFRARNYDVSSFHELARDALSERPPSEFVGFEDVVNYLLRTPNIIPQHDVPFGQPPILVFRNEAFYIEVLPWLDGTTSIHEHGFSGAFHVLSGSSIHTTFEFETQQRFSERLSMGKLRVARLELLNQGDVRAIPPGNVFIHSLFHLHRPSVSVVVRTHSDVLYGPQLNYGRYSGIAWDPFFKPVLLEKRAKLFRLLHDMEHPSFAEQVATFMAEADAFALYSTVMALAEFVRPFSRLEAMAQEWTPRCKELLTFCLEEVRGRKREISLISKRASARDPEHRYFLALLLNVNRQEDILALVEQYRPGIDPVDTIGRWVSELAATAATKPEDKNALGFRFEQSAVEVMQLMLRGRSDSSLRAALADKHGQDVISRQAEAICSMERALRRSTLLGPLFAHS